MNEIEKSRIQEISNLHQEIIGHLKMSLEKAIRIGELLTEQKASMKHGEFTPWIKANLPFTDRTTQNYMRVYRERDRLKTETVSDLTQAYQLLQFQGCGEWWENPRIRKYLPPGVYNAIREGDCHNCHLYIWKTDFRNFLQSARENGIDSFTIEAANGSRRMYKTEEFSNIKLS